MIKKSEIWLIVIFHGRQFENGLREAIYTQIVTVNILTCYKDMNIDYNCLL